MPTGLAQNLSFILLGEDRTASKTMTAAQATAEKVTGRIGSAFSKLGGVIGGEFGQVLDQTGAGIEKLGAKGAKLSTTLEVGGAITAGAGVALMQLGSGAQQASDQLDAAIVANGDSVDHFKGQIDDAVASGQNFDHSAEDTKAALSTLIPATGSTAAALSYMNVVTDLAAKRHVTLADASTLVAKILNGTGARTLTQYGITMDGVGSKTQQGQKAIEELSKKLDGQGSASVKNFGSQFDIVKTKVEDFVKDAAGPVGNVMTLVGPAFSVAGLAIDYFTNKQEKATIATIAQAVAADSAVVSTEAETGAMVGLDAVMDANPIGLVALALGGLAAIVGGSVLLGGTENNTKATADFTSALRDNTSATNENIRSIATEALLKDGALKAGAKLGLSAKTLVDASLGVASAQATVNAVVKSGNDALAAETDGMTKNAGGALRMTQAQKDAGNALGLVSSSVASVNDQYKAQTANQKLFAAGMDTTAGSAQNAANQVGGFAAQMQNLGNVSPGAVTFIPSNKPKKKLAAGGSMVVSSPTDFGSFEAGESGAERLTVTPLNSGRTGGTGSSGGVTEVHIHFEAPIYGDKATIGKAAFDGLVQAFRSGGSKSEFRHALGITS